MARQRTSREKDAIVSSESIALFARQMCGLCVRVEGRGSVDCWDTLELLPKSGRVVSAGKRILKSISADSSDLDGCGAVRWRETLKFPSRSASKCVAGIRAFRARQLHFGQSAAGTDQADQRRPRPTQARAG